MVHSTHNSMCQPGKTSRSLVHSCKFLLPDNLKPLGSMSLTFVYSCRISPSMLRIIHDSY